ncbi:MAG: amidohydrolase family protein [Armatimonadota bacterium]
MDMVTPHESWRRSIPVVDAHVHLFSEYLPYAARLMDRVGIARMISLDAFTGEQLMRELDAYRAYPGRFYAFAGLDYSGLDEPGWAQRECEKLEQAVDAGAVGLKIHKSLGLTVKDSQGLVLRVDDDRFGPIWDKAGELGIPVAFHTADPKAFFLPMTPENERWKELSLNPHWSFADRTKYPYGFDELLNQLENVVRRHPRTRIIGVHFGNDAEDLENVARMLDTYPNYYVDTAARLGEIGRHDPRRVRGVFSRFSDRILFGTDLGIRSERLMLGTPQDRDTSEDDAVAFYRAHWAYFETPGRGMPHPIPIQGDWTIDAIDLPREVLYRLYCRNAEDLILSQ